MAPPLSPAQIAYELADYEVVLDQAALGRLAIYLEILLRWNRRINLTALRAPRPMVRQLFGESLFLTRILPLHGRLLDVGSGAGFPGLALKAAVPSLDLTLVEAQRRKCAFLKEVVRACGFVRVRVVAQRLEHWVAQESSYAADISTTRAVGLSQKLLDSLAAVTAAHGRGAFYTTDAIAARFRSEARGWTCLDQARIPNTTERTLLIAIPSRVMRSVPD